MLFDRISSPRFRGAVLAAILSVALAVPALAAPGGGFDGPGPDGADRGGFEGPRKVMTVSKARGLRDDTRVVLRGRIVRHLGGKEYEFEDKTGSIILEISDKKWRGQRINPKDMVEIRGEVERDRNRPVRIEVDRIDRR